MLARDPRVSAQHFRPLPIPLLPLFTPLLPSGQDSRSFSAKSGLPARKEGGGEGPGGGAASGLPHSLRSFTAEGPA